jgi:hypothetical protein
VKHIQVIAYCDGTHDEKVKATIERTVKIDNGKPVLLDLCEPCDKPFLALLDLMERGAPVEKPERPKRDRTGESRPSRIPGGPVHLRTCPECGHVSPNRSTLGQHTRTQHGKGLRAYSKEDFEKVQQVD